MHRFPLISSAREHPSHKRRSESSEEEASVDLGAFFKEFPVTLDGKASSKKNRCDKGFSTDRWLYDKWRLEQWRLRKKELMGEAHLHATSWYSFERLAICFRL